MTSVRSIMILAGKYFFVGGRGMYSVVGTELNDTGKLNTVISTQITIQNFTITVGKGH